MREISARGGSASFLRADFASLAEVRGLADTVRRQEERLHLLINNAGIGTGDGGGRPAPRRTSADGHELRFAVNYLAGSLLTRLLLPNLVRGAPARIVNVASAAQYPLDFDNLMLARAYSGIRAYAQSKLAQVMLTVDLAAELHGSGVTVNCLHPATYMNTTMVRAAGVQPVSTVAEGAAAVMHLAVSPELRGRTGEYFTGCVPARQMPRHMTRKSGAGWRKSARNSPALISPPARPARMEVCSITPTTAATTTTRARR